MRNTSIRSCVAVAILTMMLSACSSTLSCPPQQQPTTTIVTPSRD